MARGKRVPKVLTPDDGFLNLERRFESYRGHYRLGVTLCHALDACFSTRSTRNSARFA